MARDFSQFGSDMQRLAEQGKKMIEDDIPRAAAVIGKNFFQSSWEKQGFEDNGVKPWKKRKAPKAGTKAYKRFIAREGRPILYSNANDKDGTHLKDSIKGRASKNKVVFSTDKVYAQVHNEGGKAGRGSGFTMPKREFMGKSKALDKKIEAKIDKMVDNIIKSNTNG